MSTNTAPLDTDVITRSAALISEPDVWIQGTNDDGQGHYCAHGAVLRQHCTPGDQHMWRQVMRKKGLSALDACLRKDTGAQPQSSN